MVIGITGTDGAGKGTVVHYLVTKYGYTHYSSRDFITEEIERQGLPLSRSQMRLTANEMREAGGNDIVVVKALERARAEGKTNVVIESVRALAEASYLKAHEGVILAVDADPKVRFERVQNRRSATDKVTYEQFLKHEELEKNDPNPHGMQKALVMERADFTIANSKSIADLQMQVDGFMEQFGAGK